MQFSLKKQAAKVAHVNLRDEMHGEDPVLACDVKIEADVPNTFLDQISPTLRSSFYMSEEEHSGQRQFDGPLVADANPTPVLRYEFLGPQSLPGVENIEAKVSISGRQVGKLEFTGAATKVKAVFKQGGTVELTFTCQFEPTSEQVAMVSSLLGREVKITIDPVPVSDTPPDSTE